MNEVGCVAFHLCYLYSCATNFEKFKNIIRIICEIIIICAAIYNQVPGALMCCGTAGYGEPVVESSQKSISWFRIWISLLNELRIRNLDMISGLQAHVTRRF